MEHYGTLHDYRLSDTAEDIRGSALYGLDDEKLGKIKDVIFDHATGSIRYVVVDTGGWLKSKEFIVPADRLKPAAGHEGDYYVKLTKRQVETFPPYNENAVEAQQEWSDYENRYRAAWTEAPVQHQQGTERNITFESSSVGSGLGTRWSAFEDRLRRDRERVIASCAVCSPRQQRKVS